MCVENSTFLLAPRGIKFTQMEWAAVGKPLRLGFLLRVAPLGALALSAKIHDLCHSQTRC